MRILIRCAARFYPAKWRNRYATEFDALLEDISPSLGDAFDVIVDVLRVRMTTSDAWLTAAPASQMPIRLAIAISLGSHAMMIILALWAVFTASHMPPYVPTAPIPPPAPEAPPLVTDARVFPNALTLYSSLPLRTPKGDAVRLYVANGVGIDFLSLPDIGATYRQDDIERRVWPGQALEAFLVRRVLPEYPHGTNTQGAVSVIVEYLVSREGSVKVLRTSGPMPFTGAAQSAIEQWVYRPLRYENRSCEVVSRVEVRFDSELAQAGTVP
jgi:hypothetical protein